MRTASLFLLTAVFLIAIATAPPSPPYEAIAQDQTVTVTGCVERDAAATTPIYKLIVASNGATVIYQLNAPGNSAVPSAVGKTAQVTGSVTLERRGGRDVRVLTVKAFEVTASRCGGGSPGKSLPR